jgi:hypothetical protein
MSEVSGSFHWADPDLYGNMVLWSWIVVKPVIAGPRGVLALFLCALGMAPTIALADEGGVSFWLPGMFGSLAATPQQPGWSLATIYYHTSVAAGGDVAASREITIGRFNPTLNVNLSGNLNATGDIGLVIPSYVFATPVLGGQAAVSVMGVYGRPSTSLTATLTGMLGPVPFTRSDSINDSVTGFGDLVPQASLRWNRGVHNFMTYITGDVPIGAYDSKRLANMGIGHGAVDAGGGYTYFNPQTGQEFSAMLGFTVNLINNSTQYQNGVDAHLDWGASQFLTKQWQVGLVGYVYDQVTGDRGSGDRVGAFLSRVIGVGPQIGYVFPLGDYQGYLNLKGYKEFEAEHRPEGWNLWLTFAISPAAPGAPPRKPVISK